MEVAPPPVAGSDAGLSVQGSVVPTSAQAHPIRERPASEVGSSVGRVEASGQPTPLAHSFTKGPLKG